MLKAEPTSLTAAWATAPHICNLSHALHGRVSFPTTSFECQDFCLFFPLGRGYLRGRL